MDTLHAEGTTLIGRSPGEVFEFLCDPDVDPAELTPMEDRTVERRALREVGSVCRSTVEFAARELDLVTRCTEYEPPHRLAVGLEGDLQGSQVWELAPEEGGTRVRLTLDLVKPRWLPAYLRDETTAARWGQTLVDQTLANVKTALEKPPASA